MLRREYCLNALRGFYHTDSIKIISGVRGCGKSVLLRQIADEIRLKSDNVIFLDFEDPAVRDEIRDGRGLISYVDGTKKKGPAYLFLDEICSLPGWAVACRTLRLDNSLFITHSTSEILDMRQTTQFSGRYVKFRIRPFVYKEILEYSKELGRECPVSDYILRGGLPGRFSIQDPVEQKNYLSRLRERILEDATDRHDIRDRDLFYKTAEIAAGAGGAALSADSVRRRLAEVCRPCSVNTVIRYLSVLEESYLVDAVERYSHRTGESLIRGRRYYAGDVSFAPVSPERPDLERNLENVVYLELVHMGYGVRSYEHPAGRVDFVAEDGCRLHYVQAAYSVAEYEAWKRETRPLERLVNPHGKFLITADEADFSTDLIRHLRLNDFLSLDSLRDVPPPDRRRSPFL